MPKIFKGLEEFEDRNDFALELAARDAKTNGCGFVVVDPDGSLTYVDAEEVYEIAEKIVNETNSNR